MRLNILPIRVTWTCGSCGQTGNVLTHRCSTPAQEPAPTR